jgi:hypothetical protein
MSLRNSIKITGEVLLYWGFLEIWNTKKFYSRLPGLVRHVICAEHGGSAAPGGDRVRICLQFGKCRILSNPSSNFVGGIVTPVLRIRIRRIRMIFGPPRSGSISVRYASGSSSGSFCHQAKIVRKNLILSVLWLLYDFLSLKNDVNVAWKISKQKSLETIF